MNEDKDKTNFIEYDFTVTKKPNSDEIKTKAVPGMK